MSPTSVWYSYILDLYHIRLLDITTFLGLLKGKAVAGLRTAGINQIPTISGTKIKIVSTYLEGQVFGPSAQQRDLYYQAVVPIVNEVFEGSNCTIFAYGQIGTGKTYTMEGECKRSKSGPNGDLPQEASVIPRAMKQIFDT
ncbi:hypothetical protein RHGRI_031072 [Rhododendron griersonianum]|uniref:Kinesin motor domain-containing protein n=1 Tax=Rhododendron griersonianum TaxID=479676 RepID=A0AAV6I6E4_9ERIC|nr:hypothetical protein RHGRI_031072 [Rhododendron griersonianum]